MSEQIADVVAPEVADVLAPVSEKPIRALFRFSDYVHVGEGASECPHADDGECADAEHFHAWIALPNQFQQESLVSKARAARARTQRSLRDPESDDAIVLDNEIDELRAGVTVEELIEALLTTNDLQDRLDAMRYLESLEEWEHRTEDVVRRRELEAMADDVRPQSELDQLVREADRYAEAVTARMTEVRQPKRRALEGLDLEALLAKWREERVSQESIGAFNLAYQHQEWYCCSFKPSPNGARGTLRAFADHTELERQPPEVLSALGQAFRELELSLQRQLSGNS